MKLLVSACLLGENVKYNGGNNKNEALLAFLQGHEIISVCPEVLGGLPIPRPCGEIVDGIVRTVTGDSVDAAYRRGAAIALDMAPKYNIDMAILQQRSPSCGVHKIYDGSFTGVKIAGHGVFASLLFDEGYAVFDSSDIGTRDEILPVGNDEGLLESAAMVHGVAWRDSHRAICSPAFIALHTLDRQKTYLRGKRDKGTKIFMLRDPLPTGIVCITNNVIEDLYVLPCMQNKGYGTRLLYHAMAQCDGVPTLWVLSTNERASALYTKHGFFPSGNRRHLSGSLYEYEMIFTKE